MNDGVLLIGGAGFLGSHLANRFLETGCGVAILDRVSPPEGFAKNCKLFTGDLRDLHLLRAAMEKFPRVVFLAHGAHVAPAADRLSANFLGNIELLLFVLDVARDAGVQEFVLLSSGGAVYGDAGQAPIPETHPKNPRSPYGIAKLTMEKYLAMVAEDSGIRHLSIRPSNPYGPGQNFRSAQGIVAVAMARIARGETVTIRGDGSAVKDYIFVEDFADAVVQLTTRTDCTGPFNLGSGTGTALADLISQIEDVLGRKAALVFEAPQRGDVMANVLDITKISEATGWCPATVLPDGLKQTWAWMKPQIFRRGDES